MFPQKFGRDQVPEVDGNKLTIAFAKTGEKKLVDRFVARV